MCLQTVPEHQKELGCSKGIPESMVLEVAGQSKGSPGSPQRTGVGLAVGLEPPSSFV